MTVEQVTGPQDYIPDCVKIEVGTHGVSTGDLPQSPNPIYNVSMDDSVSHNNDGKGNTDRQDKRNETIIGEKTGKAKRNLVNFLSKDF